MRTLAILFAAGTLYAQKPGLHGGAAEPSMIPNHAVTTVRKPGSHFTGAQVSVRGACRLAGYKVVSDDELQMDIEGKRAVDGDGTCYYTVRNAAGSASSWIVVALTREEEKLKAHQEEDAARAKFDEIVRLSGKRWVVHYGDGATETYTAKPDHSNGPEFESTRGETVTIVVDPKGTVTIIDGKCAYGGKLAGGEVKNGESMPGCGHPGTWTATMER